MISGQIPIASAKLCVQFAFYAAQFLVFPLLLINKLIIWQYLNMQKYTRMYV